MTWRSRSALLVFLLAAAALWAFQQPHGDHASAAAEMAPTMSAMDERGPHHHAAGPHMKLTALRPVNAEDDRRAEGIVAAARKALEKYQDPAAAEADGFQLFLPQ